MTVEEAEKAYRTLKKESDRLGNIWSASRKADQTTEMENYQRAYEQTVAARRKYAETIIYKRELTESEEIRVDCEINKGRDAIAAITQLAMARPTTETSYHVLAWRWEIVPCRAADDDAARDKIPYLNDYLQWIDASASWHRLSHDHLAEACAECGPPKPPDDDFRRAEIYYRASRMLEHPHISPDVRYKCLMAQIWLREGLDLFYVRSFWDYRFPIAIDAE